MSHADQPTYYELLGVEATASDEQIRASYRELAKHAHPDRGGNAALFRLIQIAYDTLKDPSERSAYDRSLGGDAPTEPPPQHQEPPPQGPRPDRGSEEPRRSTSSKTGSDDYAARAHAELFFGLCQWLDTNLGRALAGGSEVQTAIDYLDFKLESWQREFANQLGRAGYGPSLDEVQLLRDEISRVRYSTTEPGRTIAQSVEDKAILLAEVLTIDYERRVPTHSASAHGSRSNADGQTNSKAKADSPSGPIRDAQLDEYRDYLQDWYGRHSSWEKAISRGIDAKSMRRETEPLLRAVVNWRNRLMSGSGARPDSDFLCSEMLWLAAWLEPRLAKGRRFSVGDGMESHYTVGRAIDNLRSRSSAR